jgi:hypothetical protein
MADLANRFSNRQFNSRKPDITGLCPHQWLELELVEFPIGIIHLPTLFEIKGGCPKKGQSPLNAFANNAINCTGQTLNLTQGQYVSIRLLGSGANGDQTGTFHDTYTDVNMTQFDWRNANCVANEKVVQIMDHKHTATGDKCSKGGVG